MLRAAEKQANKEERLGPTKNKYAAEDAPT